MKQQEKVRCIDEKGRVHRIPEFLTKMPDYMRRHRFTLDAVAPMELPKPIQEVNFEVKQGFKHEDLESMEQPIETIEEKMEYIEPSQEVETKEKYWAILDEKGIKYNKNFGIAKLKELCQ